MLCSLSDDVYKRFRLLRVKACLQLLGWLEWKLRCSEACTLAGALQDLLCNNSCSKEAKADEVLGLFE